MGCSNGGYQDTVTWTPDTLPLLLTCRQLAAATFSVVRGLAIMTVGGNAREMEPMEDRSMLPPPVPAGEADTLTRQLVALCSYISCLPDLDNLELYSDPPTSAWQDDPETGAPPEGPPVVDTYFWKPLVTALAHLSLIRLHISGTAVATLAGKHICGASLRLLDI